MHLSKTFTITLTALFTALVFLFTYLPIFRIDYGLGYFNLGDVAVILGSTLFYPWLGAFSGALGASMADLLSGYALFIPFTLVAKTLEGLVAGWLYQKIKQPWLRFFSIPLGTLTMVLTYQVAYLFIDSTYAITGLGLDLVQAFAASILSIIFLLILQPRFKPLQK